MTTKFLKITEMLCCRYAFAMSFGLIALLVDHTSMAQPTRLLGRLPDGRTVEFVADKQQQYGLFIGSTVSQARPIMVLYQTDNQSDPATYYIAYRTVRREGQQIIARADWSPTGRKTALLTVEDRWMIQGDELRLQRSVIVEDSSRGGFGTGLTLDLPKPNLTRNDYGLFLPGMVYGDPSHLSPGAIGAPANYQRPDTNRFWVREDRLPAPLSGVRWPTGQSIAVLNPSPDGQTTTDDSEDFRKDAGRATQQTSPRTLIDKRFRFGSLVATQVGGAVGSVQLGYLYPGSEGAITYRGNTFPDVGVVANRYRFHPFQRGFGQQYSLVFRLNQTVDFPAFMRQTWRWAWKTLRPAVMHHNIAQARQSLIAALSSQVETTNGLTGITNWRPAVPSAEGKDPKTIMGFTGKALESAEYLLWAANHEPDSIRASRYRQQGENLFDSFGKTLTLNPPNGEGFIMATGKLATALPGNRVYLRSFTDDLKATLRAVRRAQKHTLLRPDSPATHWLAWARTFGDWLLTQQRADGGLPRAWQVGTGQVADSSATSGYNAVPFLLLLTELTDPVGVRPSDRHDGRYEQAAIRAGQFAWQHSGQQRGQFTGGTIDNPDVLDKEAGTLSLEAYLALYERTKDPVWLDRARAAADFAETWIYVWNVPMPVGDGALHWKRGVPTVGLQLIATGHSLADAFMGFDVDEYARLYRYTNDRHYLDVARILLHNTLAMTALPGRTYDLLGPGWQQEHWSLAPWRGHGFHRGWLPWVTMSHLNGMIELEEFDRTLYEELTN